MTAANVAAQARGAAVANRIERTLQQREAEAASTGDAVELAVTRAENAAVRSAGQPPQPAPLDLDALAQQIAALDDDSKLAVARMLVPENVQQVVSATDSVPAAAVVDPALEVAAASNAPVTGGSDAPGVALAQPGELLAPVPSAAVAKASPAPAVAPAPVSKGAISNPTPVAAAAPRASRPKATRDTLRAVAAERLPSLGRTITTLIERGEQMRRVVIAARKSGMTDEAIRSVLDAGSVSRQNVEALLRGEIPPFRLSQQAAEGAARQAELTRDKAHAAEVKRRFEVARDRNQ
ncbi:hypothetical protein [Thauera aromatica]|uniref:hypothetical protein n=1 Tax=Thauera aromatica TaxID=59405 RepID=UPI001FFCB94C|nr:hypothetical protein [Thauera aromatica]